MLKINNTPSFTLLRLLRKRGQIKQFSKFLKANTHKGALIRIVFRELRKCLAAYSLDLEKPSSEKPEAEAPLYIEIDSINKKHLSKTLNLLKKKIELFHILQYYKQPSTDQDLFLIDFHLENGNPKIAGKILKKAIEREVEMPELDQLNKNYQFAIRGYKIIRMGGKRSFEKLQEVFSSFEKYATFRKRDLNLQLDAYAPQVFRETQFAAEKLTLNHSLTDFLLAKRGLSNARLMEILGIALVNQGLGLSHAEAHNHYQTGLNELVYRSNRGDGNATEISFKMLNLGINSGILVQDGLIARKIYRSVITTGIHLINYSDKSLDINLDWLENFNETYRQKLLVKGDDSYYLLNKASILFSRGEYTGADLIIAQLAVLPDTDFKLAIRWQQLKIQAMMEPTNIDLLIKSTLNFFGRNNENYLDLPILQTIRLLAQIINLAPGARRILRLEQQVKSLKFTGKYFLQSLLERKKR